jgi:hypothetical protein
MLLYREGAMILKLSPLLAGLSALVSLWLVLPSIGAEPKDKGATDPAAQNFAVEHEIGRRFRIDPNDLPAPKTGPIVTNRVLIIPFGEQTLTVPKGFTATPFATPSTTSGGMISNLRRAPAIKASDIAVTVRALKPPEMSFTVRLLFLSKDRAPIGHATIFLEA